MDKGEGVISSNPFHIQVIGVFKKVICYDLTLIILSSFQANNQKVGVHSNVAQIFPFSFARTKNMGFGHCSIAHLFVYAVCTNNIACRWNILLYCIIMYCSPSFTSILFKHDAKVSLVVCEIPCMFSDVKVASTPRGQTWQKIAC